MVKFKGKQIKLVHKIPSVGEKAPDFELVDTELATHRLYETKNKMKILYCVPSLDTQVCYNSSKSLSEIAREHPEMAFFVISCDLPFAMKRHAESLKGVTLLSLARSKQFAHDYGLLIEDSPLEGLLTRALFVLDENNTIIYEELVDEITTEPNFDQLTVHFS
ncbi:MAG: thiol peroxidase [Simkaniaceae bacterium]|nr:thiol peroxidase [Simkaniaceae bacterium]